MTPASQRDMIFAFAAILAGLAGLWLVHDYVPKARHFPLVMCLVIAASGVVILVGTLRRGAAAGRDVAQGAMAPATAAPDGPDGGPDTPFTSEAEDRRAERVGVLTGALPFGLVLLAWALAVSFGAGYLVPGFVAGLAMMWISGARRPLAIVAGAGGTVLFCFTMFYILFQTRLPETKAIRALVAPLRDLF